MKVKGLLVAAAAAMLCFGAQSASAIEAPNHEGDFFLNIQGGLGGDNSTGLGASVSADYVLINSWWKGHFTIGGFVGTGFDKQEHYEWIGTEWIERTWVNTSFMARATYGLNITDKFEVHAGAMAGATLRFWSEDPELTTRDNDGHEFAPNGAGVAGIHFMLSDNFALTSEFIGGLHITYFNAGISFKF